MTKVREKYDEEVKWIEKQTEPADEEELACESVSSKRRKIAVDDYLNRLDAFLKKSAKQNAKDRPEVLPVDREITTYDNLPELDMKAPDPLKWWREKAGMFPILSLLARQYLFNLIYMCYIQDI